MRQLFFLLILAGLVKNAAAQQNVGIGTLTPVAGLHIMHNNGIIAKGDTLSSNAYVLTETGAGAKLVWHPKKAAFLAGNLDNSTSKFWDEDSVGFGAMILGYANKVRGYYSFATGIGNTVSGGGYGSIAMGHNSFADSNECVAIGFGAEARQRQAIAIGTGVVANGRSSFATGFFSYAGGYVSTAGGYLSAATGDYSFSNGLSDSATGYGSVAIGSYSKAKGFYSTALGAFNYALGNSSSALGYFSIANGESSTALGWGTATNGWGSMALGMSSTSNGYGSMVLGNNNMAGPSNAAPNSGIKSFCLGNNDTAFSFNAFTIGNSCKTFYPYSFAIGNGTKTQSNYAFSIGNNNTTFRDSALAFGNNIFAGGQGSVAIGYGTTTDVGADYSIALGKNAQVSRANSVVMGSSTENSFTVGIGTSNPSHAKLEINNSVGAAVAMFGANKFGVTIEADNPEVGFNYFYNNGPKTIKAGYASVIGMSPATGETYIGNYTGNQSASDFGNITGFRQNLTLYQNGEFRFAGSTYFSHFFFGVNEDTYIRGGKNISNVIVGDLNNAVVVGNGPASVGYKLTVQGNTYTNGNHQLSGFVCATAYNSCSDIRYKTNFSSIEKPLQKIEQLHAIYYNWKQEEFPAMHFTGARQLGLSAQEVEKLFPEIVQTNADGYKAVDYSRLTPVLIEGIKAQQQQIDRLKRELNELKQLFLSKK
jgi:Chaperone of endosialidase/Head domain of trimeric autotransporter adhesin